jgi:hypothetical protein
MPKTAKSKKTVTNSKKVTAPAKYEDYSEESFANQQNQTTQSDPYSNYDFSNIGGMEKKETAPIKPFNPVLSDVNTDTYKNENPYPTPNQNEQEEYESLYNIPKAPNNSPKSVDINLFNKQSNNDSFNHNDINEQYNPYSYNDATMKDNLSAPLGTELPSFSQPMSEENHDEKELSVVAKKLGINNEPTVPSAILPSEKATLDTKKMQDNFIKTNIDAIKRSKDETENAQKT